MPKRAAEDDEMYKETLEAFEAIEKPSDENTDDDKDEMSSEKSSGEHTDEDMDTTNRHEGRLTIVASQSKPETNLSDIFQHLEQLPKNKFTWTKELDNQQTLSSFFTSWFHADTKKLPTLEELLFMLQAMMPYFMVKISDAGSKFIVKQDKKNTFRCLKHSLRNTDPDDFQIYYREDVPVKQSAKRARKDQTITEETQPEIETRKRIISFSKLMVTYGTQLFSEATYNDVGIWADGCTPTKAFNLWQGFAAELLPMSQSELEREIKWFLDFTKESVCAGDETSFLFVCEWLHVLFTKLDGPLGTLLALVGPQGIGKSFWVDIIAAIIGESAHSQFSSLEEMNGYNNRLLGRRLYTISEGTVGHPTEVRKQMESLKAKVTDMNITQHAKYENPLIVKNIGAIIWTMNDRQAMYLESSDRRICLLEMKAVHTKDDHAYWSKYRLIHQKDPRMMNMIYTYFVNYKSPMTYPNGKEINVHNPPQSSGKLDMMASGTVVTRYVAWVKRQIILDENKKECNPRGQHPKSCIELWGKHEKDSAFDDGIFKWAKPNNEDVSKLSFISFGRELTRLSETPGSGLEKAKKNGKQPTKYVFIITDEDCKRVLEDE